MKIQRFFIIVKNLVIDARSQSKHKKGRFSYYLLKLSIKTIWIHVLNNILLIYTNILKRPTFHIIGDSHTNVFWGHIPFIVHHIGPATAYNLCKEESSTQSKDKINEILNYIHLYDSIILVFGEIDCRIHIYYQYMRNQNSITINQIIDNTISNYSRLINEIKKKNKNIYIYNVPPPSPDISNHYNYPSYGTPEIRAKITEEFNSKLISMCSSMDLIFIDIYSQIADEKGLLRQKYSIDDIHLDSSVFYFIKIQLKKSNF
jgi:hypothetical protein